VTRHDARLFGFGLLTGWEIVKHEFIAVAGLTIVILSMIGERK